MFFRQSQSELKNAALRVDVWRGHQSEGLAQTQVGVDTFILCYKQQIKEFMTCDVKQMLPDNTGFYFKKKK